MNTSDSLHSLLGHSYLCFPRENNKSFVHTLARHGYLAAAPEHPATAFSFNVLQMFIILSTGCHQLSVQGCVWNTWGTSHPTCAIQILFAGWVYFQVLYPCYRNQFVVAFDKYIVISSEVDKHVANTMGCNEPNWHLKNACPPCMYALKNKPPLQFSMEITIDGNNSQKWIECVQCVTNEASEVVRQTNIECPDEWAIPSDYYLSPEECK